MNGEKLQTIKSNGGHAQGFKIVSVSPIPATFLFPNLPNLNFQLLLIFQIEILHLTGSVVYSRPPDQ